MSFLGQLLKAGISTDGRNISAYRGTFQAQNIQVPFGNIYYVSKDGANTNDGRSWGTAFLTFAKAVTTVAARITWSDSPWAENDIIMMGPGTFAENITALPHGCIVIGAGFDNRDAQFGTKFKPASGVPIDVGAFVNGGFFDIGFEALASVAAFDADVCNNVLFERCRFQGPAETATATGFISKDCTRLKFVDCEFDSLDKGIDINYADANDKFAHCKIKGCDFTQIDTAGIEISTNLVGPGSIVDRCNFLGSGMTMAAAIDDNSGILDVVNCNAEATLGYDGVRSVNNSYLNGALQT